MKEKEWFAAWFDSPYYPILYQNRNESEATTFIQNLLRYLDLAPQSWVLDLACGRGRHARTLQQLGMKVQGWDLSPQSIADARHYQNESLTFEVHDMRERFPLQGFQLICNLFTSFGYFDTQSENLQVLFNIQDSLSLGGICVIDYFNTQHVLSNLVSQEQKKYDEITFNIQKSYTQAHIFKDIEIWEKGAVSHFQERVQLIRPENFEDMLTQAGLSIKARFGDYQLNAFDAEKSPRLILIAEKK